VMKFGGTSLGTAEGMAGAADLIVQARWDRPVVAVVSAMARVTDMLLDTMRHAEAGDREGLESNIRKLQQQHGEVARALFPETQQESLLAGIQALTQDFERICQGILMLGEKPPRSVDEAVATGEKLSALLMAALVASRGLPARAVDGSEAILTDATFGNASPIMDKTRERARNLLLPQIESGAVPVVTGFNGATIDGRRTTLGRGGSDFSASILAAALDAAELWIWTDVDGIMTADPSVVPDAAVLDEVSYNEAAELAYNGAKVLHPRTLAPLVEKQIPVWSKNSFAPHKPGTKIVPQIRDAGGVRAITSLARVALITIEAVNASMQGAQIMARVLDALARVNVEVLMLSRSSYRQNFCMLVRQEELEMARESLESALALELAHGYLYPIEVDESVGLLAIVGEGMRGTPGLAGRLFTAISREKINIIAIAQGSSELTIAIVVKRDTLDKAVRAVHAECGLGERRHAS
ncbi:MAG: aspartate kinase, partial [Acidobacteria bacterium]|nr:aspartate kinase [Acidobacteriota bacterium]